MIGVVVVRGAGGSLLARVDVQHGHAGFALDLAAPDESTETPFDVSHHLREKFKKIYF
jgi:hypothetical protein